MAESTPTSRKRTVAGKILRILLKTVLGIILFIAVVALLILTPPVQNLIKNKAVTWLSTKLNTKVELGKIYIGFPKNVVLENFYLEDQQKDTLLSGEKIRIDISMLKLFSNELEISNVSLSGITGKIKRVLPDTVYNFQFIIDAFSSATPTPASEDSTSMKISVKQIALAKVNLKYDDDVSATYATLHLDDLQINTDQLDLDKQEIVVSSIELNNTFAGIRFGKKETPEKIADTTDSKKDAGWRVLVRNIELNNNHISYNDDNKPVQPAGMDYFHLDVQGLTIHADNFLFSNDTISASITKGQLSEKNNFELKQLETDFLYSGKQAYLHHLLLETPGTMIRRSAEIRYASMDSLKNDIGQLQLDVDLDDAKVQVKDILTFAPFLSKQPAFANPDAIWSLNGHITGSVGDMDIQDLEIKGFGNTSVAANGMIKGLPDVNKLQGNLNITSLRTTRKDIMMLVPKGTLPSNITIPDMMNLRGTLSGSMNNAKANLQLTTNLGNASVNGSISHPSDKYKALYQGTLTATRLDLGAIMQNDSLFGPLTASVTASGKGFDPKTANARVKGKISSAVLNRYNYRNISFEGRIAAQKGNVSLNSLDPNLRLAIKATSDFSKKYPAVTLNGTIDSIRTQPLHFTSSPLTYSGKIAADFPNTDLDNLQGKMLITQSVIRTATENISLDTLSLISGKNDSGKFVTLKNEILNLSLTGNYHLAQMGSVFTQAIQPYYSISDNTQKDTLEEYDFNIQGRLVNGPLLKTLMPALERLEPIVLNAAFKSNEGWQSDLHAPLVIMGTNRIQEFKLKAGTADDAIRVKANLEQFSSGAAMIIYATSLDADIADNKINFLANLKDATNKNKYRLGGIFEQPEKGIYSLALHPDSLMLNYERWNLDANNLVKLNNGDIHISNLVLGKNGQELSINSSGTERNAPLDIGFNNFRIGTITAIAKQDSLLIDGVINGKATINDIATAPTFTSALTVTDLMFRTDTVGNLDLKVVNETANIFKADVSLTGKGNDLVINGNYDANTPGGAMDMVADLRKLQMSSVEAFSMGSITRGTGYINGKFDIKGSPSKPDVNGFVNFNDAGFSPTMLGSFFRINNERINIDNRGIHFGSFSIRDSANNELTLDGDALTTNFTNYTLDMHLTADNFQALNSTKQNSKLFYGKFYFDADLHITGTEKSPKVDGDLLVGKNTKLTVVLPQSEPGVEDREGIIRFIDMDSLKVDTSIAVALNDTLSQSDITGMDISVNIEINKEAELTLIIDEGNGDFLQMKGTAQLTGGIDPGGKVTLSGSYEIEEGAYQVSINLLKRKFNIQKGSKITWLGEPTRADVNLTAIFIAETAPLTLVEGQTGQTNMNLFKQKLPFEVNLLLTGALLKPDIKFDITLPDNKSIGVDASVTEMVDTRLIQLRSEPSELNKQVFALLLLKRFISENPFASSGDGFNAETMARQSVSRLLTEQLNSLAADLIKGVDLNFDLASSEDYSTGNMQNRTDLNVSVSKQLLNDRLKVTVGSNFELEGSQNSSQRSNNLAGNVALDYLLSKDGRYMVRAYRKNEYEGVLDGYIIETGLNFIITFDYNKLRELFHSPKAKKQVRKKAAKESSE